jgi:hypothetical protein
MPEAGPGVNAAGFEPRARSARPREQDRPRGDAPMTIVYRCLAGAAFAAAVAALAGNLFAAGAAEQPGPQAAEDRCVSDSTRFKAEDRRAYLIVTLENKCAHRITCAINARVRTARGNTKGHGTVALAPRAAAVYRLRVKAAGGMAQVERQCRSAAD